MDVRLGTINTMILIASSITAVFAWAAVKMRQLQQFRLWMGITILLGITFLFIKLGFEYNAKFHHFGVFIKQDSLAKYEPYLGNKYLAGKGLAPRYEISGHLEEITIDRTDADATILDPLIKNIDPDSAQKDGEQTVKLRSPSDYYALLKVPGALLNPDEKDPALQQRKSDGVLPVSYTLKMDTINADPTNPDNDRPHIGGREESDKEVTVKANDVQFASYFTPNHSTFLGVYYLVTVLHALHIVGGLVVFIYFFLPKGASLYKTDPEHFAQPHRSLVHLLALRRSGLDARLPGLLPTLNHHELRSTTRQQARRTGSRQIRQIPTPGRERAGRVRPRGGRRGLRPLRFPHGAHDRDRDRGGDQSLSSSSAISMHLKSEKKTITQFLFFTAVFIVVLFGLTMLAFFDSTDITIKDRYVTSLFSCLLHLHGCGDVQRVGLPRILELEGSREYDSHRRQLRLRRGSGGASRLCRLFFQKNQKIRLVKKSFNTSRSVKTLLALLAVVFAPAAANACSVCMGASDSSVAPAANGAIFFMIGVVGAMLAGVAGFIFHLARSARLAAQTSPGTMQPVSMISEEQHA